VGPELPGDLRRDDRRRRFAGTIQDATAADAEGVDATKDRDGFLDGLPSLK
jgi:hypothetical protein